MPAGQLMLSPSLPGTSPVCRRSWGDAETPTRQGLRAIGRWGSQAHPNLRDLRIGVARRRICLVSPGKPRLGCRLVCIHLTRLPRAAWSIVYLAVFGSALGFVLYFHLLQRMQASRLALVAFISPVLALVLGQVLNGELISRDATLGAGIILLGLALFHWGDGLLRRRGRGPGAAPTCRSPRRDESGNQG